ncbi:MAG TPA: hypothetical protein PKH77_17735, partial [Anaerolineae bacterium]|nr:hypothetical protein [Anaerolineae bacterium]
MNQSLPVVKHGEKIDAWLSRAVPPLVEMHQLNTAQANRLAKQAWSQVNGGSDLVAKMTGADSPTFDDESSWGENVVNEDAWPDADQATEDDPWPDPFSQSDFDALVSTAAAPTADAPTADAPTAAAPTAAAPTAAAANGVAALLSTLNQLTAIVSGLQGIADVISAIAEPGSRKPVPSTEDT